MTHRKSILAAVGLLLSRDLLAHAGHGRSGYGHYLLEPEHLIGALMGLVGIIVMFATLMRQWRKHN